MQVVSIDFEKSRLFTHSLSALQTDGKAISIA